MKDIFLKIYVSISMVILTKILLPLTKTLARSLASLKVENPDSYDVQIERIRSLFPKYERLYLPKTFKFKAKKEYEVDLTDLNLDEEVSYKKDKIESSSYEFEVKS
jgi:hypothetical protein